MILLRAQAWQLFLLIMFLLIVSSYVSDYWTGLIVDSLTYILIFGWFLTVGLGLNDKLTDHERKPDVFFILNCVYLILFATFSSILDDGGIESEMPTYILLLAVYFAFSFFYVVYFAAIAFISVQKDRLKDLGSYSTEIVFLSFFVFIVGIWILQPRIREIFKAQ